MPGIGIGSWPTSFNVVQGQQFELMNPMFPPFTPYPALMVFSPDATNADPLNVTMSAQDAVSYTLVDGTYVGVPQPSATAWITGYSPTAFILPSVEPYTIKGLDLEFYQEQGWPADAGSAPGCTDPVQYVTVSFAVPADVVPGTYKTVIVASSAPPSLGGSGGVAIGEAVGMTFTFNVAAAA